MTTTQAMRNLYRTSIEEARRERSAQAYAEAAMAAHEIAKTVSSPFDEQWESLSRQANTAAAQLVGFTR